MSSLDDYINSFDQPLTREDLAKKPPKSKARVAGEKVGGVPFVGPAASFATNFGDSAALGLPSVAKPVREFKEGVTQGNEISGGAGMVAGFAPTGTAGLVTRGGAKVLGKTAPNVSKVTNLLPTEIINRSGSKVGKFAGSQSKSAAGRVAGTSADFATQGALTGGGLSATRQWQEGQKIDPKEIASDAIVDGSLGAGLGAATKPALGVLNLLPKIARSGVRGAKDWVANSFFGLPASPLGQTKALRYFEPVLNKVDEFITPDELSSLASTYSKKGDAPRTFRNAEEFYKAFKNNPKAQKDLMMRYLAKRYPDAKDVNQIYERVGGELDALGGKMELIESSADLLNKGDPITYDAIEGSINNAYKSGYKKTLANASKEEKILREATDEFFEVQSFDIDQKQMQQLSDPISRDEFLKGLQEKGQITEQSQEALNEIFSTGKIPKSLTIKTYKPKSPVEYRNFLDKLKQVRIDYGEMGAKYDPKSKILKDYVKEQEALVNHKIDKISSSDANFRKGLGEYTQAKKEYAILARIRNSAGGAEGRSPISPFQSGVLARQASGMQVTGPLAASTPFFLKGRYKFPQTSKNLQNLLSFDEKVRQSVTPARQRGAARLGVLGLSKYKSEIKRDQE